jgi:hypothetical protein
VTSEGTTVVLKHASDGKIRVTPTRWEDAKVIGKGGGLESGMSMAGSILPGRPAGQTNGTAGRALDCRRLGRPIHDE